MMIALTAAIKPKSFGMLTAIIVLLLAAPVCAHAAAGWEHGFEVAQKCMDGHTKSGRWYLGADMNCDGVVTVSDVERYIGWVFYSPGDFIFSMLMRNKGLATFFELTPADYGNWGSTVISALVWLCMLIGFGSMIADA